MYICSHIQVRFSPTSYIPLLFLAEYISVDKSFWLSYPFKSSLFSLFAYIAARIEWPCTFLGVCNFLTRSWLNYAYSVTSINPRLSRFNALYVFVHDHNLEESCSHSFSIRTVNDVRLNVTQFAMCFMCCLEAGSNATLTIIASCNYLPLFCIAIRAKYVYWTENIIPTTTTPITHIAVATSSKEGGEHLINDAK